MRNKVKRNNARRLTSVLLMLLMIMGSFSMAAFADEVPEEKGAETTANAPAESAAPVVIQPSAQVTQPSPAAQPSAENSQPASNVTPAADAPQADSSNVPEEAQPATEEAQPAVEETQPVADAEQTEEDVQAEASQPDADIDASEKEVKNTALVQLKALRAAANETPASESGNAGAHDLTFNFDELPDSVSLSFNVGAKQYLYDGAVITDITTDDYKTITDPVITVAAGSQLVVVSVIGLPDDFQQGSSPGGKSTKQLKLVLKDSNGNEIQRLSLNNSTKMSSTGMLVNDAVTAVFGIANRIRYSTATDIYHKVISTSIVNTSDYGRNESEHGSIFAMEGDKIVFDDDFSSYEHVDVSVTDAAGKSVAVSGGTFTMPSSMATLKMVAYYKARNVNVINTRPERGTLSVNKDQYRPGDKVVVKISSNSGYSFDTKTLAYIYKRDGKMTLQKITKDKDGKYSFIMPFYDIDLRGVFVGKETAASSSDPATFIEYADGEDEEEEEAAEEPAEEENAQQMLDVTPLVSRIVAETVLTATVSVASMTH